jgi:hypothetical protein
VKPRVAALPPQGWTRRRAGDGTPGPRWDDGRWRSLVEPPGPGGRRGRLGRRRRRVPTPLTAARVFAPQDTTWAETGQVAGTRGTLDSGGEASTGAVGLDDDAVRRWTGWDRPSTRARWAYALWVVWRAGPSAVEAFNNSRPCVQKRSGRAPFKAQRGLACRCACQRCGDGAGA